MTGAEVSLALVAGVAVGALSAALGVGGGLLMVPFMVLALETSQHLAEGTSLVVMVPTAIAGVVVHGRRGLVDFPAAFAIAALGIAGAYVGARLALEIEPETLKGYFGVLVVIVGLDMIRRGIGSRRGDLSDRGSGPDTFL